MAAEENEKVQEDMEVNAEDATGDESMMSEDQLAETLISEGLEGSSDDDLEAQMAAAMAADSLDSSGEDDDLEAQMAAAMAIDTSEEAPEEEEDLESQMAAALEQDSKIDEGMLNSFPMEEDSSAVPVMDVSFDQLVPSDEAVSKDNIDRLMDIGLNLSVELGRKEMKIKEILNLGPGKIIELDKLAGEPVDLLVNGKLLAKGEVVVVDENFGVRITELVDPVDRIKMLK